MNQYLIPFYGLKGIVEHAELAHQHKLACDRYHKNPTPENYRETWRLFEASWPAMDNATIGLWSTAGAVISIVVIGALIASLIAG